MTAAAGTTAPRIVIVDDDVELASVVFDLLTVEGFQVDWFRSVFEAVRGIEERAPDLIVLDLHLPDGEGVEVMRRISTSPPVIVLSATTPMHLSAAARAVEAFAYLRKPFDPEELVAQVRAAIAVSRPPL